MYLDASNYLPLGYTFDVSEGDASRVSIEATYTNEFVALNEDVQTLLDPSSIGYGVADADALLDQVAANGPVYWLGLEFPAAIGLGDLVLDQVLVGEQQGGTQQTYRVRGELVYQAPNGHPVVRLFLWRNADWEAFLNGAEGSILTNPACTRTEEAALEGGRSTLYILPPLQLIEPTRTPTVVAPNGTPAPPLAPQLPTTPATNAGQCNFDRSRTALVDTLIGVAEYGDTVIEARQDGYTATPALMRTLLEQLRQR